MPDALAASSPASDARADTARLASSSDMPLPCLHCGYDLRMHPGSTGQPTGDCPECGCPLAVTRRLDPLRESDTRYLDGLERGTWWLVVSVMTSIPIFVPGLLIAVVAAWRLTAAEPGRFEPVRDRLPRLLGRWGVTLGVTSIVGCFVAGLLFLHFAYGKALNNQAPSFDIALLIAGSLIVVGLLALWRHLRNLTQRAEQPDLLRRVDGLHRAWIIAIATVGGIALIAGAFDWTYRLYAVTHWLAAPGLFAAVAVVMVWLWVVTLRAAIALRRGLHDLADMQPRRSRVAS